MNYEQGKALFQFLTDKGLGVEDILQCYDLIKPSVEAEDDFDRDADGVPMAERKAMAAGEDDPPPFPGRPTVGGKPQGQDRRRQRRPNLLQMAMDTVLDRKGLKRAASDSDAAKGYNARFPEAARLGSPLPNYSAPRAARTQPTTRAQDESYEARFPEASRIQH
jgi:hypothetical protein